MYSNSIPYILLFWFSIFLHLLSKSFKIKKNLKYNYSVEQLYLYFFYLSIVLVFLGCRGLIGADWLNYYPAFHDAPSILDDFNSLKIYFTEAKFEKGYLFFNILCKSINDNYFFFQFANSFINVILLHVIFKRYCREDYYLAWSFFLCFNGFLLDIIILRNAKAILLFIISIKYIDKKRPVKYFLLNIIGFLFHSSAILFFPVYFLQYIKRNKKIELIFYFLSIFIYVFQIRWISAILIKILPPFLYKFYAWYLVSDKYGKATGITIGFIERLFTFLVIYRYVGKLLIKNNRFLIFWYCMLIYLLIYNLFSEAYILIERLPNLFICSYWILYTKLYRNLSKKRKYVFLFLFLGYGTLKLLLYFKIPWAYYENFLFKDLTIDNREKIYLRSEL